MHLELASSQTLSQRSIYDLIKVLCGHMQPSVMEEAASTRFDWLQGLRISKVKKRQMSTCMPESDVGSKTFCMKDSYFFKCVN